MNILTILKNIDENLKTISEYNLCQAELKGASEQRDKDMRGLDAKVNFEVNKKMRDFLSGFCVKNVLFYSDNANENAGHTIVKFYDGSSVHVGLKPGEEYDRDKAFCYCILKKLYQKNFKSVMRKWDWEYKEQ